MAAQRQGIRAGHCTQAAWLMLAAFLILAAGLMASIPARAAPASEGGAFLTGEITVTQATALVGASTRWSVSLTPLTDALITAITFEPLDAALWAGPVELPVLEALAESRQVALDMIPLVTGEVWPALLVRFMVDDVPASTILASESSVEIVPVSAQLD
ncbi:MAG: hypothetical protein JXN59_09730, partial [Anaerolineae bacterium]|nr:hypothetical protein [Anaerolineae bacterium]